MYISKKLFVAIVCVTFEDFDLFQLLYRPENAVIFLKLLDDSDILISFNQQS